MKFYTIEQHRTVVLFVLFLFPFVSILFGSPGLMMNESTSPVVYQDSINYSQDYLSENLTDLDNSANTELPQLDLNRSQISGDNLNIGNDFCQLDFTGQYLTSMNLDGDGSGIPGVEWLGSASGYEWHLADGTGKQYPTVASTWENITLTIPGGNTTDGVYRLNTTLGNKIQSVLDVWLNGSEITMEYTFTTLQDISVYKNGWLWIFDEPLQGWSPEMIDMVWSYENGQGRHCMTMHQMKRRPFHYIWSAGSDVYGYQGLDGAKAFVNFTVPNADRYHLFLNIGGNLGISTWPFQRQLLQEIWNVPSNTTLAREYTLSVNPMKNWLENGPRDYPRFEINTPVTIGSENIDYGKAVTRLFWERAYTYPAGVDGNWIDWSSSEFAWNTPRFLAETMANIENMPLTDGHVPSWQWLDGWPFPDNDSDMNNENYYDTRHPTTNPNFITAVWRIWQWTANDTWLLSIKPLLDDVTAFFMNMIIESDEVENQERVSSVPGAVPLPQEAEGLLLCDWKGHHGGSGGIGNNYWDIMPFGWMDSYANALAYGALLSLADFEEHWGNTTGASMYETKASKLKEAYNAMFWDDIFGRYIGCVDAWGERHDYGFTFINQQAAFYGLEWGAPLVNITQAHRIYNWMENEPTGSGSNDTFTRWIYAARSNTDINHRDILNRTVEKDWWAGKGQTGDAGYRSSNPWPWCGNGNGQLQNGGCSVYTSFHDLMARTHYFSSDHAETRFRAILNRWSLPDHMCGGSPLYLGEDSQQEDPGSVGTDYPFPESGLVPTFIVYGLMGMNPLWKGADSSSGLPEGHVFTLNPFLPSSWTNYSAMNLQVGGTILNVTINATSIQLDFILPIDPALMLEVNGTRYNISTLLDGNGRAIISWDPREGELAQREAIANLEYSHRLSINSIYNALGEEGLDTVPTTSVPGNLTILRSWWYGTIQLMTMKEYQSIQAEINQLEQKTKIGSTFTIAGKKYLEFITLQRIEAKASQARGDMRWTLGNYRQASVIADRVLALEQESLPAFILLYAVIPACFILGIISIMYKIKSRKITSHIRKGGGLDAE